MADYNNLQTEGLDVAENFQSSEWLRFQASSAGVDTIVKIIGLELSSGGVNSIELRADLTDAIKFNSSNIPCPGFIFLDLKDKNLYFQHWLNKLFFAKNVKLYDIDYKQNMTTMCLSL